MLLRGMPRRRKVWLSLFVIAWTVSLLGVGFLVGEIGPLYRGNGAIRRVLHDTHQSLEAGECEQVRAAFSEAGSFLQRGGEPLDAVKIIAERLQRSPSPATPAAQPQ
jgi:hypothetical protein